MTHQPWISDLRAFALELCAEAENPSAAGEVIELGAAALVPGLRQLLSDGPEDDEHVRSLIAVTSLLAALEAERPPDLDPALQRVFHAERASRRRGLIASITRIVGHDLRRMIDPQPTPYAPVIALLTGRGFAVLQVACTSGITSQRELNLVWTIPGCGPVHCRAPLLPTSAAAIDRVLALHGDQAGYDDLAEFYRMVDDGAADDAFRDLSGQLLPEEFLKTLESAAVDRLLIVPDPMLWNIPWSALATSDERRLVDIAAVSLSPALGLLDQGDDCQMVTRPAHAWLADVEGIDIEIGALRDAFGEDLVLAESGPSLLGGLQQDAQPVGTVVISVHGQAENGLAHGVVLAPGVELTAAHLLGWQMPRTLVIGACWTARVNPEPTGDQIALATLAVAKGAVNVVGAIYPLPDEIAGQAPGSPTAVLLAEFYRGLSTHSVARAIWVAQKSLRHLPAHSWAGLVHVAGSVHT